MGATANVRCLFKCIVFILIFSNSLSAHVSFENVSLSTSFEHLITIPKSNCLKEYLPTFPLPTVIVTGKIPILYEDSVADIDSVENLEFRRNGIEVVEPGAFKNLASVRSLWFTHNQLRMIKDGVFDNLQIEELHLNYNPLSKISKYGNLPNLTYLSFAHDEIDTVEENAFENLQSLKVLDLSSNRIRTLPKGIFKNLSALTRILLGNNQIDYFEREVFDSESLQYLDLNRNRLTIISEQMFTLLPELETIVLSSNDFKNISKSVLSSQSLTTIELRNCNINFIDAEAFDGVPFLTDVKLSENNLTEYNSRWFKNTLNVSELVFSGNSIMEIPKEAFENFTNQKRFVIKFDDNKIKRISSDAFRGLKKVEQLDLSHNELEAWDDRFLEDVEEIDVLNLIYNKIQCFNGDFDQVFKANVTHLDHNPLSVQCLGRIEEWEAENPGRVQWRI